MRNRALALIAGTIAGTAVFGSAAAAPSNAKTAEFFELVCDNGETYDVVVNGNGEWTPGHVIGGGVLIPTAFPSFEGVFTDAEGNEFSISEPPSVKGRAGANRPQLTCTFDVSFSDPATGESFEAVGEVVGFLTGKPTS